MHLLLACAPAPLPPGEGPTVSFLSYNVNFERFDPATVDAIAAADADVVLLQETTATWQAALRARLSDRYPTMTFHSHDPDGGMGLLARRPATVRARMDSPVGKFPATCLDVATALGTLRVLHVHLHPPLDEGGFLTGYFTTGDDRAAEVAAYLACAPDLAVGDFNEAEGDAVDRIEAAGLRDAASAFPPPTRTWSYASAYGELEGRPDHVFFGPTLVPVEVAVLEAGASDHRPLRVEFKRRAP